MPQPQPSVGRGYENDHVGDFDGDSDEGDDEGTIPSAWQSLARAAAEAYGMPVPSTTQSIDRAIQRLFGSSNFRLSETPRVDTDDLPDYQLTQEEIDSGLQCTICLGSISQVFQKFSSLTVCEYVLVALLTTLCCHVAQGNPRVIRLECSHMFHRSCIAPWLEQKTTCPVCRYDITGETTGSDPGERDAAHAHAAENEYELWVARLLARAISPLLVFPRRDGTSGTAVAVGPTPIGERDAVSAAAQGMTNPSSRRTMNANVAASPYVPKAPFSKNRLNCTSNPYAVATYGSAVHTSGHVLGTPLQRGMRETTSCDTQANIISSHAHGDVQQRDTADQAVDDMRQRRERIARAAIQRQQHLQQQQVNSQNQSQPPHSQPAPSDTSRTCDTSGTCAPDPASKSSTSPSSVDLDLD